MRPPSPRIIQQPQMMSFNKSYLTEGGKEADPTKPRVERTKRLEADNEFITMCESYLQDITDKYLRSTSAELKQSSEMVPTREKKVPRSVINLDIFSDEKENSNPVKKPLKPILKKKTQKGQSQPRQMGPVKKEKREVTNIVVMSQPSNRSNILIQSLPESNSVVEKPSNAEKSQRRHQNIEAAMSLRE